MPMATKLGMVVTYHEGLPPIKSHYPLIFDLMTSRDKLKASLLPECP